MGACFSCTTHLTLPGLNFPIFTKEAVRCYTVVWELVVNYNTHICMYMCICVHMYLCISLSTHIVYWCEFIYMSTWRDALNFKHSIPFVIHRCPPVVFLPFLSPVVPLKNSTLKGMPSPHLTVSSSVTSCNDSYPSFKTLTQMPLFS